MKLISRLFISILFASMFLISSCEGEILFDPTIFDPGSIDVTTLAGSGDAGNQDGTGINAQFNEPDGVTVKSDGTAFITDMGNHDVKKIELDGTVTTIAGVGEPGFKDGDVSEAQFNYPDGIVIDSDGNIYVGDSENNRVRKISTDGEVTTIAGTGEAGDSDGPGGTAMLDFPTGITIDSENNLYVVDEGNNKIKMITPDGDVATIAGTGSPGYNDGSGLESEFDKPHGITTDTEDNIYVTDQNNNRIRKIDKDGKVTTVAGDGNVGYADGDAGSARMNTPHGIGVSNDGEIFFADENNSAVRKIGKDNKVVTYAGNGQAGYEDGEGKKAKFNMPRGLAVGWNKDVYICDYSNNRVRVIKKSE